MLPSAHIDDLSHTTQSDYHHQMEKSVKKSDGAQFHLLVLVYFLKYNNGTPLKIEDIVETEEAKAMWPMALYNWDHTSVDLKANEGKGKRFCFPLPEILTFCRL